MNQPADLIGQGDEEDLRTGRTEVLERLLLSLASVTQAVNESHVPGD